LLPKPLDLATQKGVLSGRPTDRLGIQADDLRAALAEMDEFVNVGERELNEIYKLAGSVLPRPISSPPYTGT